jgi:hypothetical protein
MGGLTPRRLGAMALAAALTLILLLALAAGAEVAARHWRPAFGAIPCQAMDPDGTSHGIAGCRGESQAFGAPRTPYAYDRCGYRNAGATCGPKPAGARRVVMLGASFTLGVPVPIQDSYVGRLEPLLSHSCGADIEIENLGAIGTDWVGAWRQMPEALGLAPDLVVLGAMPTQFAFAGIHEHLLARHEPKPVFPPAAPEPEQSYLRKLLSHGPDVLRLYHVVQELNYRNADYYANLFLKNGDASGYLQPTWSPQWEQRLADFDVLVGEMADQARAAGVPFAILFTPSRAESAILGGARVPAGVDALALPRRLRAIAERHQAIFIDTTPDIARVARPQDLYFPVDTHPNERGYDVIARSMAHTLTTAPRSPFATCRATPPVSR